MKMWGQFDSYDISYGIPTPPHFLHSYAPRRNRVGKTLKPLRHKCFPFLRHIYGVHLVLVSYGFPPLKGEPVETLVGNRSTTRTFSHLAGRVEG